MTNSLSRLTDQLLRAARKAGADEADSIAVSGSSVSIDVRGGKLEHAERSEGTEIGLRVLIGKQQACVSASDIRDNTITMMAERAVAMARDIAEFGYTFPYLIDDTQEVAKAYRAACTPDFFVFDAELRLAYRGQFDDSRPENDTPVTGRDLRAAVDTVAAGQRPIGDQRPNLGCNIKWKPGNAPDYFA